MFQEVPIRLEQKTDNPMYTAAIRDALAIIDNEIEKVMTDRENETTHYKTFYNDGKLHGFRRIRGLLESKIEAKFTGSGASGDCWP